jgi:hypothetical protein
MHDKEYRLNLDTKTDEQIFALLAWEFWTDGMDWGEDLASLAEGKTNLQYKNREDAIKYLQTVFGY